MVPKIGGVQGAPGVVRGFPGAINGHLLHSVYQGCTQDFSNTEIMTTNSVIFSEGLKRLLRTTRNTDLFRL